MALRIVENLGRLLGRDREVTELREVALRERNNADLYRGELQVQESLRELVPDEIGWRLISESGEDEFTADERRRIAALCQLMAIKSPLIKRGLALRYVYVHGRGVQIAARANGKDGGQDVNAVVQAFLDDPLNSKELDAEQNELALGTDGDLFHTLWTKPVTGAVRIRKVPHREIVDIICNPQDAAEVWFYKRVWTERGFDAATGMRSDTSKTVFYPDVHYRPPTRVKTIGGNPVQWDAPIVHIKVNSPAGWRFGVPDAFASCDWALAYKTFLENWARLMMSLSRFAWKVTTPGSKTSATAAAIAAAPTINEVGQRLGAGATAVQQPGDTLEAIPKTGATLDSESGRPLAAMTAAGLGIPVTMLLGDPGITGARATAETLDEPMRLTMEGRRDTWTLAYTTILNYVIDQAIKAPQGKLQGTTTRNEYEREITVLTDGTERTLDITWPDLSRVPPIDMVKAVVAADQTGKVPPLVIARLLLEALGETDIDEILEELTDDQGRFLPPDASAGQAAVDAFRRGQDPAAVVGDGTPQPAPPEEAVP